MLHRRRLCRYRQLDFAQVGMKGVQRAVECCGGLSIALHGQQDLLRRLGAWVVFSKMIRAFPPRRLLCFVPWSDVCRVVTLKRKALTKDSNEENPHYEEASTLDVWNTGAPVNLHGSQQTRLLPVTSDSEIPQVAEHVSLAEGKFKQEIERYQPSMADKELDLLKPYATAADPKNAIEAGIPTDQSVQLREPAKTRAERPKRAGQAPEDVGMHNMPEANCLCDRALEDTHGSWVGH